LASRILIVAGEASADLHGSALVREIKSRIPDVEVFGVGGGELRAAGVRTVIDAAHLSVMGTSETLGALGRVYAAYSWIKRALDERRPDLVILIDFPEVNLPVARQAKKRSIPVLYFISPQVWAWRRGRVRTIARTVSKMLVIFPFEEEFYRQHGVDAEYVGHPLTERVSRSPGRDEARSALGLQNDDLVFGILPGSRRSEINSMLPVMLKAADIISGERPDARFIIPKADTLERREIDRWVRGSSADVMVVESNFELAVRACDAAMVTSGTATLHTALLDVPMVIAYRAAPLSYLLGRLLIRVRFIGIVNLIAGRKIAEELIQEQANPANLARASLSLARDPVKRAGALAAYREVKQKLGAKKAAEEAAKIAASFLR